MTQDEAREILMRHAKSERNGTFPSEVTHSARLVNPLCGDQVEIKLKLENEQIVFAGFSAKACAICSASASILCSSIEKRSVSEVEQLKKSFETSVIEALENPWPSTLSEFESFSHLRANPRRRTCAILPWVAVVNAIRGRV